MAKINIEIDKITIGDLESLVTYSGFGNGTIPKGFILDNNIMHGKAKLLQEGIELDSEKISTLTKYKSRKPDFDSEFSIRKNDQLNHSLKEIIKGDFKASVEEKAKSFSGFASKLDNICEKTCNELLNNEDIIYEFSKIRLFGGKFYRHSINTMLYSIGMGYLSDFKFSKDEFVKIAQIGMLHNIGALVKSDSITMDTMRETYFETIVQSSNVAKQFGLSDDVCSGIYNVSNYPELDDFISKDDKVSIYSNLVLTAMLFDQMYYGLFKSSVFSGKALDSLYVKVTDKQLNKDFVDILSNCLKLEYLFNFYNELTKLIKTCNHDSAVPYPNAGFHGEKTATLFLCKQNQSCEYSKVSIDGAVTLVKSIPLLKGDKMGITYKRCINLTNRLIDYYEKYYDIIKQQARERIEAEK